MTYFDEDMADNIYYQEERQENRILRARIAELEAEKAELVAFAEAQLKLDDLKFEQPDGSFGAPEYILSKLAFNKKSALMSIEPILAAARGAGEQAQGGGQG